MSYKSSIIRTSLISITALSPALPIDLVISAYFLIDATLPIGVHAFGEPFILLLPDFCDYADLCEGYGSTTLMHESGTAVLLSFVNS